MDDKRADSQADRDREGMDPGPETVDPAPWLGQVGEGATLPGGETIARVTRKLTDSGGDDDASRLDNDSATSAPGKQTAE